MNSPSHITSNPEVGNSSVQNNDESAMSKRQMKRIRRKEKWLERKGEKRVLERQKAKEKRAHARANNIDLGPSRKALKKCTMATSDCRVAVTIDMSYDDLMLDKDVAKLTKQILRCYTLNRRAVSPVQFSLTAFGGRSKQEMQKHNGYQHWDVKFFADSYLRVYQGRRIVYLTSESENVLYTLRSDCVYVIGGMVDHNSHKGHCHKLAMQHGIGHARLPLDTLMHMKARKVLTVDHVFEILLRVIEGRTWQQAFMQVLPVRKQAEPVLSTKTIDLSKASPDFSSEEKSPSDEAKITEETTEEGGSVVDLKAAVLSNSDEAKVIEETMDGLEPDSKCAVISNIDESKVTGEIMEDRGSVSGSDSKCAVTSNSAEPKVTKETMEGGIETDSKCVVVGNSDKANVTEETMDELEPDSNCALISNIDEPKVTGEIIEDRGSASGSNSKCAVTSNSAEPKVTEETMEEAVEMDSKCVVVDNSDEAKFAEETIKDKASELDSKCAVNSNSDEAEVIDKTAERRGLEESEGS